MSLFSSHVVRADLLMLSDTKPLTVSCNITIHLHTSCSHLMVTSRVFSPRLTIPESGWSRASHLLPESGWPAHFQSHHGSWSLPTHFQSPRGVIVPTYSKSPGGPRSQTTPRIHVVQKSHLLQVVQGFLIPPGSQWSRVHIHPQLQGGL